MKAVDVMHTGIIRANEIEGFKMDIKRNEKRESLWYEMHPYFFRNWSRRTSKYMHLKVQLHIFGCPGAPIPKKSSPPPPIQC